jgi:hypothetical protein
LRKDDSDKGKLRDDELRREGLRNELRNSKWQKSNLWRKMLRLEVKTTRYSLSLHAMCRVVLK